MNKPGAGRAQAFGTDVDKRAFHEGLRVFMPMIPGVFAWGLVTGMAMVKIGLTVWQALGMTFLVYAGSAQLAALPLIIAGIPLWVVFVTALTVNLRFVIFSAALAPHFTHLPWYKRLYCGYFNADVTMALFPRRFPPETIGQTEGKVSYFTGICYSNWLTWQVGSVLGILLASWIPESWGVGFAGTLALLAITIPLTMNSAALAGVVVAATVSVAASALPYRLGLLVGVISGMAAAMAVDWLLEKRKGKR
jgi:predicted branched-subunit amino acid permease